MQVFVAVVLCFVAAASSVVHAGLVIPPAFPNEAEDADFTGGARVESSESGFTGTGYVRFVAEGHIEWTVNVATKGLHTLLFRFRKGAVPEQEDRPLRVVDPDKIEVNIAGTERRKALVMDKLGTIPREEEVELPVIKGSR